MALKLSNKAKTAKISTFGLGSSRKPDPKIHGGKGAGLIEMSNMGLEVPPGFVIHVSNYHDWLKSPEKTMTRLRVQIKKTIARIEKTYAVYILYSVRSGAEVSMPGMMDTILNVGATAEWVYDTHTPIDEDHTRWVLDCRRRFLQMFGAVVKQVPAHNFEKVLAIARADAEVNHDSELTADQLLWVVSQFAGMVKDPDDPLDQIMACVEAVFRSWLNPRAVEYREQNNIPESMGTAVIIQLMVFGNQGKGSGSGVIFSRNPSTGDCMPVAEYLENAQGEDVVAGVRTPLTTSEFCNKEPNIYHQIVEVAEQLENHYSDMVDIEFTVVAAKLYILQVRVGKRTGAAAFRIARQFLDEGHIDMAEVRKRLQVSDYTYATRPRLEGVTPKTKIKGSPASPGIAQGILVASIGDATEMDKSGQPFIWVAHETNPNHIAIMNKAQGVLTEVGGITSHAAVVARGMNKPCVTACPGALKLVGAGNNMITMDGSTGQVWTEKLAVVEGGWSGDVTYIMTMLYQHMKARFKGPDLVMDGQVLQCGHWFHNPSKGQGSKALTAIQKGDVKDVVLDVRVLCGPSSDDILAVAMGVDSAMVRESNRQMTLFAHLLKHDFQSVVTLTGGSDKVLGKLVEAGYRVVQHVSVKSFDTIGLLMKAVQAGTEVSLEGLDEDVTEDQLKKLIPALKTTPPTMTVSEMLGG